MGDINDTIESAIAGKRAIWTCLMVSSNATGTRSRGFGTGLEGIEAVARTLS